MPADGAEASVEAKKKLSLERQTLFGMVLVNLGIAGKNEVFPNGVPKINFEKESIYDTPNDNNGFPTHALEGASKETLKTVHQMMQAQNAIVERVSHLVDRQETGNPVDMTPCKNTRDEVIFCYRNQERSAKPNYLDCADIAQRYLRCVGLYREGFMRDLDTSHHEFTQ